MSFFNFCVFYVFLKYDTMKVLNFHLKNYTLNIAILEGKKWKKIVSNLFNPFQATGLFLYPLKTSGNQRFSDVFRGYKKRPVAWNELKSIMDFHDLFFKSQSSEQYWYNFY